MIKQRKWPFDAVRTDKVVSVLNHASKAISGAGGWCNRGGDGLRRRSCSLETLMMHVYNQPRQGTPAKG